MAVSIVIPAYNEKGAIKPVVEALLDVMNGSGLTYEVIVVDDGSRDETAVIAESIPGITVLRHYQNKGYGAALKTGIRHAHYDLICITDADSTYPNDRIPELVQRLQKDDLAMVVGARTGQTVQVPLVRRPAKYVLRTLANYLSGMEIPDLNSGLRVFKREIALNYFRRLPSGFSFTTSITLAMLTNDYNVLFVPIDYFARTGQSKIRPIQDTINFFSLMVRMVLSYRPLRVFIPLAIIFGLMGTAKVIYDINAYDFHLATSTVVLLTLTFQIIILGLIADLVVSLHKS